MWDFDPQDVVFLTGAGISANAPTNGPLGNHLTEFALAELFDDSAVQDILGSYQKIRNNRNRMPRLEAVLDKAVSSHGDQCLNYILHDLVEAPPNYLHLFFAQHLKLGGVNVTANFDRLIEKSSGFSADVNPFHFHGSLQAGAEGQSLGATLHSIVPGFNSQISNELDRLLFGGRHKVLIVAGYSGIDFFDMDVYVRENLRRFLQHYSQIMWIHHDHTKEGADFGAVNSDAWVPPIFSLLQKTFEKHGREDQKCFRIAANTGEFLAQEFSEKWRLSEVVFDAGDGGCSDAVGLQIGGTLSSNPTFVPTVEDRRKATVDLCLHFGLFKQYKELMTSYGKEIPAGHLAEIAWQEGRYRDADRLWRDFYRDEPLKALERKAACLWVRGSYLRAYRAIILAHQLSLRVGDDRMEATVLALWGRILFAMRKCPELRLFVGGRCCSKVRKKIAEFIIDHPGVDAMIRSDLIDADRRIAISLGAFDSFSYDKTDDSADGTATAFEFWDQADSLSGYLDYGRGRMWVKAERGEPIPREWVEWYVESACLMGQMGQVYKMPMLPGVGRFYSLTDAWGSLSHLQITWLHRLRGFYFYLRDKRRRR
ncbi:hypothetical protein OS128_08245 [Corynebacterium sp. P5848]|uniref:hypothetical protein n=1 Tax=Corynebacterium marambiense TaxID=2765364 RepID=UPI0022609784|nr:hypothetical protein [Corynebacterium marambiense]MCX7542904.1 hypothetical protein [Corynebacterium marambiense]